MVKKIITLLIAVLSVTFFTGCEESEDCRIEYYVKYKVTSNNAVHPAQLILTTPPLCEDESNQLRMYIDGDFEGGVWPFL